MKLTVLFSSLVLTLFTTTSLGDLLKVPSSLAPKNDTMNKGNDAINHNMTAINCNESEHPLDRRNKDADLRRLLTLPSTSGSSIPNLGGSGLPSYGSGSIPSFGTGTGTGTGIGLGSGTGLGTGTTGSSLPGLDSGVGTLPSVGSLASTSSTESSNATTPANSTRDTGSCSSYIIIDTRGTGEVQGPSSAFRTINSQVLAAVPGGKTIDTVYPAGATQDSTQGSRDIVSKVTSAVSSNSNGCIILQGYSQGAAATVNAMKQLTGANMDAVKGVFLVGNPLHKSGLACNVDNQGGATTRGVNGMSAALGGGIPDAWVAKTLDVCISGDGVCDTTHGLGINAQHLSYPTDASTQKLGLAYIKAILSGQTYTHS